MVKKPQGGPSEPNSGLEEVKEMIREGLRNLSAEIKSLEKTLENSLENLQSEAKVLKEKNERNAEEIKLLNARSKDIVLNPDINSFHLLPKKNDNSAVKITFTNMKFKGELLKQGRKLKETKVFINENLTKKNASIAWKARQIKKGGKILKTWTRNCRIYITPLGEENGKPILIKTMEDLGKYEGST
uniref:Uncharacterized protein n=1 Tax=Gouania willdenowi TaxID=441366 RepID=A0A8C5NDS0_GOUWI